MERLGRRSSGSWNKAEREGWHWGTALHGRMVDTVDERAAAAGRRQQGTDAADEVVCVVGNGLPRDRIAAERDQVSLGQEERVRHALRLSHVQRIKRDALDCRPEIGTAGSKAQLSILPQAWSAGEHDPVHVAPVGLAYVPREIGAPPAESRQGEFGSVFEVGRVHHIER